MKGVSAMLASAILVLITVVATIYVSGWLSTLSSSTASEVRNNTNTQLQCQYADIYIKNATYNCGGNCTTGTQHTTTLTIVNSGKKTVSIDGMFLRNTTGYV